MKRAVMVVLVIMISGAAMHCEAQTTAELNKYFQDVGLNHDQIAAIRGGQAVAMSLNSRIPDEVFIFGAVFVKAAPESYLKLAYDFDRFRQVPEYLAIGQFSNPPQMSDLNGFSFDSKDIQALKDCKPDDCQIQLPASGIEGLHKAVDLSAPDAAERLDQYFHERVIERLVLRPLDYVTKLVSGMLACERPLDGNPVAIHPTIPGPSLLAQASDVADPAFA